MVILIMLINFSNSQAQKSNSENLYMKALILHLKSLATVKPDTIIVQKENFFPVALPDVINKCTIKYLSEEEINVYDGNSTGLLKVFPIELENDFLVITITYFGYNPKYKLWENSGGSHYRFKYQCDNKKFIFVDKVEYGI
jgi:hypothetical protein